MRRVDFLMALAILFLAGPVLEPWTAQPAPRYLLTVAVAEHHTLTLDDNAEHLDVDQALHDGQVFSDKAPYQPLAAVPFLEVFRAAGGDTLPETDGEVDLTGPFHWGRWWVGLWSSTVPAIGLCLVVRRLVEPVHPTAAVPVALALSVATLLLPFASALFGHVLAAFCLGAGWLLVRQGETSRRALFAAGALLSGAVGTEYTAAVPAAIIVVSTLLTHRIRAAPPLLAGGVLGAIPLLAYNWMAFDNPLTTAYQGKLPNFQGSGAFGVYNLVGPQAGEVVKALVGDRGLLTMTPVCALAVGFALIAIDERKPTRRDGVIALTVLSVLLVVSTGIDGYGGAAPGPRYLIPALPFLAVPLADAWTRFPRICWAATIAGAVPMIAAMITAPLLASDYRGALAFWLRRVASSDLARSVPGEVFGEPALYATVGLGLSAAAAAVWFDAKRRRETSASSAFSSDFPAPSLSGTCATQAE